MIIDLNLKDRTIVIIGGGNEALKRINTILNQNNKIIVISEKINSKILELSKNKKIQVLKKSVKNPNFIYNL